MDGTLTQDPPGIAAMGKLLLLAGIAAPVTLVVAIAVAGQFEPGYSHVSQYVSELGATGASHPVAFNYGGLFLSGLLTVLFSLGFGARAGTRASLVASSVLVAVAGLGRIAAGIFPCDAGCSLDDMSTPATIHAAAGFIALMSGAFAPVLLAVGLRRSRRGILFWLSACLGSASVVLVFMLFGLGKELSFVGAIQRSSLATFYAWVVAVALILRKNQPGFLP